MAEQNYRQYGWPIPRHLQPTVAAIAPDLKHTFSSGPIRATAASNTTNNDTDHSSRLAAGQGKLQEVDLGSAATSRTHKNWKRLEDGPPETPKVRLGRDGKPRRGPQRRNSSDIRRDQLVDAVLRESKRPSPLYPLAHTLTDSSGILRRRTRQPALRRHRRRHGRALSQRVLRVDRGAAAAQTRPAAGRKRPAQGAETGRLEEREGGDAVAGRDGCEGEKVVCCVVFALGFRCF